MNGIMKDAGILSFIAFVIVLIGGINWGLIGLFRLDVIGAILGNMSLLSRLAYIIIGVAAGYLIYMRYVKTS